MEYLSASKLKGYRNCPFRHKNEKYAESEATKFGNSVHAGIAEWLRGNDFLSGYAKEALKHGLPPEMQSRAVQCFEKVRDHDRLKINRENILTIESEDGESVYHICKKCGASNDSGRFTGTCYKCGWSQFIEARKFQVSIGPGWGLRGAMDLVDVTPEGILRIPDWKTGYGEEIDDLQLACYALVAFKKYPGFQIYETGFFYVDKGVWVSTRWDEHSLVGAYEAVEKLALAYIAEKDWPQKTNKYCSYCTLKAGCDAFKAMTVQMPDKPSWDIEATLENFPEICERLRKIEAIKKVSESIFETLKERRETVLRANQDKIQVGDHVIKGVERASAWKIDVGSIFLETEKLIGRAPFEIVKLDSGAFGDLVKEQTDRATKIALNKVKKQFTTVSSTTYKVSATIAGNPAKEDDDEEETAPANPVTPGQAETVTPKTETNQAEPETKPAKTEATSGTGETTKPKNNESYLVCVQCGSIAYDSPGRLAEPCAMCHRPGDQCWTKADTFEGAETFQRNILARVAEKQKLAQELSKGAE